MLKENDFFYCYTNRVSRFLATEGINYIVKAKSIKDDRIFTMYEKSDELTKALKKYNEIYKKQ